MALNFTSHRKAEQVQTLLNLTLLEAETCGSLLNKYSVTPDDANLKMRNMFSFLFFLFLA